MSLKKTVELKNKRVQIPTSLTLGGGKLAWKIRPAPNFPNFSGVPP